MTQTMTENRFKFWRILVALAHQDHEVTQEERDFIISKFEYLPFSKEQEAQLEAELNEPQNAMVLFDQLDNNEQRAECIYMAHNLFASDDDYHPIERAMYDHMKEKHMSSIDTAGINEDLQSLIKEQNARDDDFDAELADYREKYDFGSGWLRFFKGK